MTGFLLFWLGMIAALAAGAAWLLAHDPYVYLIFA